MKQGKTILLVLVVLVVLGVLIYLGSNQPDIAGPDTDNMDNNEVENVDNDGDAEGNEGVSENDLPPAVFNTSGEIISISSDSITVQTDGSHMQSGENVSVTVTVDSSTNILDSSNNDITLSDLSEGDQVSIESGDNIKDQTEFSGSNIKLSE